MKVKCVKESVLDSSTKDKPLLPSTDSNGSHFSDGVLNHTPMVCLPKVCEDMQFGWTYSNQLQDVGGIPELQKAFNTFPYPTSDDLITLALRTSKPLDKIKAWFMWQRIKYGISWNPEDIEEMRLKLGVPNCKSKRSGPNSKNVVKIKEEVIVKLEPLGMLPFPSSSPPPLQDSCYHRQPVPDVPATTSGSSLPTMKTERPTRSKALLQQQQMQQSLKKHIKTEAQLALLRESFLRNNRPRKAELQRLVRETGLPSRKVTKWFSVNRGRLRRNRVPLWVELSSSLSVISEGGEGGGERGLGDNEVKTEPLTSMQMLKKMPNNTEQEQEQLPPLPLPFVPLRPLSVPLKPLLHGGKPLSRGGKPLSRSKPLSRGGKPLSRGGKPSAHALRESKFFKNILSDRPQAYEVKSERENTTYDIPAQVLQGKRAHPKSKQHAQGDEEQKPLKQTKRASQRKARAMLPINTSSLSATTPPAAARALQNEGSTSASASSLGPETPRPRRRPRPRPIPETPALTRSGRLRKTRQQMEQLRSFFLTCQWPTSEDYTVFSELCGISRTDVIQWYGDTRYAVKRGQLRWAHGIRNQVLKEISQPYGGKAGTCRTRKRRSEAGGEVSSHSSRKKKRL